MFLRVQTILPGRARVTVLEGGKFRIRLCRNTAEKNFGKNTKSG